MHLAPEQEAMLAGENGSALADAMNTLVAYGEAFGAARMVPIRSAHVAGSFGARIYKAYFQILTRMAEAGVRCRVPTTINPRPGVHLSLGNRFVFSRQKALESLMERLGVTPNYSCVCYDGVNVPGAGEAVCWSESSAVQFANSVLGARTNRNSLLIDLCAAVTGVTPEFGYLLAQNRRGQLLVRLNIQRMDASALGFLLGKMVVDKVPVIEHADFSFEDLKNMGGAMAASGGVALFHVEGLTPEAPDLKTVFDGDPKTVVTVSQADLDAIRDPDPKTATSVVFGCPQMTFDEACTIGALFSGRKTRIPTYFCMVPEAMARFEKTRLYGEVAAAGVRVVDFCPLAAFTMRRGNRRLLTPSGKLFYYLKDSVYGNLSDCLGACGV